MTRWALVVLLGLCGGLATSACPSDRKADIVFVVDSSASVRDGNPADRSYDNWDLVRQYLAAVVGRLPVSHSGVRVGAIYYSDRAYNHFYLHTHTSASSVQSALRGMLYLESQTNTAGALLMAREFQLQLQQGHRSDVHTFVVLVSDGKSTINTGDTIPQATRLKNGDVTIVTVGVGQNADMKAELEEIASSPVSDHTLWVDKFVDLELAVSPLVSILCPARSVSITPGVYTTRRVYTTRPYGTRPPKVRTTSPPEGACTEKQLDLVFVVSSSRDIRDSNPADGSYDNWELIKDLMSRVVARLPVHYRHVRVGAYRYSTAVRHDFYMRNTYNQSGVLAGIRGMQYMSGSRDTAKALGQLGHQFAAQSGSRYGVAKVAVVLLDGPSDNNGWGVAEAARRAQNLGIRLVGVGLTQAATEQELLAIAGTRQGVLRGFHFMGLDQLVKPLVDMLCTVSPTLGPPPTTQFPSSPTACPQLRADVVFLLDTSDSIRGMNPADRSYDNWSILKHFLTRLTQRLPIGSDLVRVGASTFGTTAKSVFYLNTYPDRHGIEEALGRLEYFGGKTNTAGGLREVRGEQFVGARGDRTSASNTLVLLADGPANMEVYSTLVEAQRLHNSGVRVLTVAVGGQPVMTELRDLASAPQAQHAFSADSFRDLELLVEPLVSAICGMPVTPTWGGWTTRHVGSSNKPWTTPWPGETGNKDGSCVAGQEYDAMTDTCRLCGRGYYREANHNGRCVACPRDHTTEVQGSTSTNDCVKAETKSWTDDPLMVTAIIGGGVGLLLAIVIVIGVVCMMRRVSMK